MGSLAIDHVRSSWERTSALKSLARIPGPWAVALWDPATKDHLLVTDPLGIQPLFWARTQSGEVVASSWLAPLVNRPDVDDSLDYEGILLDGGWGFGGEAVAHRTRFRAVSRVPWGRALRIRPDGSTWLEQYWDPADLPGPDPSLTLADCAELLRERIDAAVRRLTPTDMPVGAHISGGLDCTAVACRANQVLRESGRSLIAGYSWAPSEEHVPRFHGDERRVLDDVAASEGLPIRTVNPGEAGDWFWQLDPNRYPQSSHGREIWTLPQANADGVRVLLSGWGGDELASFNGRGVIPDHLRHGRLRTVWRDLSRRLEVTTGRPPRYRRRIRAMGGVALSVMPFAVQSLRDPGLARTMHRRSREIDASVRGFSPMAADLRLDLERQYAQLRDHHEVQLYLLRRGHLQHRIGWWYQTGRLMGINYRYPLLDLGVVEAALRLPWWAFQSQGWTRVAFRLAIAPWAPESVAWNVTKDEPALFWPPRTNPVRRAEPAPTWVTDDPDYLAVMRVVEKTRDAGEPTRDGAPHVVARPALAPRI